LTRDTATAKQTEQVQRIRNLAISILRLAGQSNIARALRHNARDATRPLKLLGIT
jgi:hypothetical protein